jgi:hypothetical protein
MGRVAVLHSVQPLTTDLRPLGERVVVLTENAAARPVAGGADGLVALRSGGVRRQLPGRAGAPRSGQWRSWVEEHEGQRGWQVERFLDAPMCFVDGLVVDGGY